MKPAFDISNERVSLIKIKASTAHYLHGYSHHFRKWCADQIGFRQHEMNDSWTSLQHCKSKMCSRQPEHKNTLHPRNATGWPIQRRKNYCDATAFKLGL